MVKKANRIHYRLIERMPDNAKSYRKKSPVIKAIQLEYPFAIKRVKVAYWRSEPGDYLIKGDDGELYACSQKCFESTYEEAT